MYISSAIKQSLFRINKDKISKLLKSNASVIIFRVENIL